MTAQHVKRHCTVENEGINMTKLFVFNFIMIAIIVLVLYIVKRTVKSEKQQNILLICASVGTVLLHYSMLFYHVADGTALQYLKETPNLILPIYPCNLVMWFAVIFAFCKNKRSRLAEFLGDYIFWFGLLSALVGMFANVDFIMNPTFADYAITKSIVAHVTLLFNILLLPLFGYVKMDLFRNMKNILISIVVMLFTGLYCNLLFAVLASEEVAYDVNSMFLLHSPFEGADFLTYPVIALMAIPIYFAVFAACDYFAYEKGNRFYNRFKVKRNGNIE